MKTLQTLSTAIILTLTSSAFSNGGDDQNKNTQDNNSELTINIVEIKSPSCNGSNNGMAEVVAKGGEAPYTYNWNTFPNQTTAKAINLSSGTYFVQVIDATGAVFFKPVYVEDPNSSILTDNSTLDGEVDLTSTVSGNNAPYTYELNGNQVATTDLNELSVGLYKLVVKDVNNCEMVQYIQVFELHGDEEVSESAGQNQLIEMKNNNKVILSKNDRQIQSTDLIPTKYNSGTQNSEILVTVSSR